MPFCPFILTVEPGRLMKCKALLPVYDIKGEAGNLSVHAGDTVTLIL